jgi:DNA-binding MarR family transcriptional regulator
MGGRNRRAAMPQTEAGALPRCVCGALRTVTRAVTQLYDDALRPSGLRITQYGLMSRIRRLEPVSAAQLVDALHADQTTLARALKLLEREGLVRRAPQADRRVKRIELTGAGARRLAAAHRLWALTQRRVVALAGEREWKDLRARLGALLAAAEKEGRAV